MSERESIAVTGDMVNAGIEVLEKRFDAMSPYDHPRSFISKDLVIEIYRAMTSATECASP